MGKMYDKKYRLGLDIGTTSIGWAMLNFEEEKIIRLGVRKFEEPREPKTGETLTVKRREKRRLRRTIRRRAFRKERMIGLLERRGVISREQLESYRGNSQTSDNIFLYVRGARTDSPWALRARGLRSRLEREEWARVLFHLVKHRGYQSNSIEKKKEAGRKTDAGKLLAGVDAMGKDFREFCDESPELPHSIGEMIYHKYPGKKRNSDGQYSRTVGREWIEKELETLFDCQGRLGNPFTGDDFLDEVRIILNNRRNFAEGPGKGSPYGGNLIERMLGKCTLDENEKRGPRDSWTAVMFRLHQFMNNVRIVDSGQTRGVPLAKEQKEKAIAKARSVKKFTYAQLRKEIGLQHEQTFQGLQYNPNYRDIQKKIHNKDEKYYREHISGNRDFIPRIQPVLDWMLLKSKEDRQAQLVGKEFGMSEKLAKELVALSNPESKVIIDQSELYSVEKSLASHGVHGTPERINEIARILSIFREDAAYRELVKIGLPKAVSEELALISFSKFMHLSIKTMDRLLPHLMEGDTYDIACEKEGFEHAQLQINRDNITNPTVFRAFNQTKKLVNIITKTYGSPRAVYLECARDLSRSKKERDAFQKSMGENESLRRKGEEHFSQELKRRPIGREAQVWRFYREQNGKCLYCGRSLGDLSFIFARTGAPAVEIEHTLPYARSLDNRQCNKTAACTECNRNKGDRTPFEFFGSDKGAREWHEFQVRCGASIKDKQKLAILLTTEWDEEGTGERQINDTRYITRLVQNWLERKYDGDLVATPRKGEVRSIIGVKGEATSILRKIWGLERYKYDENKTRESEKNHALDAAVVAAASFRYSKIISDKNRKGVLYKEVEGERRVNKKIKEIIPPPWENFSSELRSFCGCSPDEPGFDHDPNECLSRIDGAAEKYGIEKNPVSPLFISWMPRRSVKGAIHKETIYRVRDVQDTEDSGENKKKRLYLKRIGLQELNSKNIGMVAGRFDSSTGKETPFYVRLKERLELFGGDGKKAFSEPFRKGDKPDSPFIYKVRICQNTGGGMPVLKGAAENGDMIRVDIFRRRDSKGVEKYFLIPLYTRHRVLPELPLKAIAKGKLDEREWHDVLEEEFLCSLYTNDFVRIVKKKDGILEGYYVGTHRNAATITLHPHDSRNDFAVSVMIGVLGFCKFHVDVLGSRFPVHLPEKRVPLSAPKQNG